MATSTSDARKTRAAANKAGLKDAITEINYQLDKASLTIRSARLEVAKNIAQIRTIRERAK